MAGLTDESIAYHLDLVQHLGPAFDQAACVTVVPGGRSVGDVVEQLGTTMRRSGPMSADEFGEASYSRWDDGQPDDDLVWVIEEHGTIALLESNGFAGTRAEILRPLSRDGQLVASMMWIDANGANQISVARDAEIEACNADYGDELDLERCPTLAPYLPQIWAMTEPRWIDFQAGGLAALEALTGFRLTRGHLEASWPAVWFRAREEAPARPPSTLGLVDAELALALSNASRVAYRRASVNVAIEVARAAGLSDHPAVRTLLSGLSADELDRIDLPVLHSAAYGWQEEMFAAAGDPTDDARRRYFAGRVLSGIAAELTDDMLVSLDVRDAWFEAERVLGNEWGAARARALRVLAD